MLIQPIQGMHHALSFTSPSVFHTVRHEQEPTSERLAFPRTTATSNSQGGKAGRDNSNSGLAIRLVPVSTTDHPVLSGSVPAL